MDAKDAADARAAAEKAGTLQETREGMNTQVTEEEAARKAAEADVLAERKKEVRERP